MQEAKAKDTEDMSSTYLVIGIWYLAYCYSSILRDTNNQILDTMLSQCF